MIEQTRFLSTVFSCRGIFYSGVNFCGKMFAVVFICGNLFLRIAGKITKIAKIRTSKSFVPRGTSYMAYIREYSPGKIHLDFTS